MTTRRPRRLIPGLILLVFFLAAQAMADQPLRMVYFDDFAPYSTTKDGHMEGILPDAMSEACRRLGIPLENRGYPWARAQNMVRTGQSDGFVTVPTAERKTYALTGKESIITLGTSFYTWSGNPAIERLRRARSLADLRGLRILDYIGDGWGKEHLAGLTVHEAPTMDHVLRMLANKRGDVFAQISLTAGRAIVRLGLWDKLTEIPKPFIPDPLFVLCLAKSSPFASRLPEFEAAFRAMKKDGSLERIIARYR